MPSALYGVFYNMYFNSFPFLFVFLPITVVGFFLIGSTGMRRWSMAWLTLASLFFYAYWNPIYLILLLSSIIINFSLGIALQGSSHRRTILTIGIVLNLCVLGFFKYTNFFFQALHDIGGIQIVIPTILLPLGISFITFQKIAFLIDTYRRKVCERDFLRFCLFVTFFPQLIAGPIVHQDEIIPQLENQATYRFSAENLAIGLTILLIGLAKKTIIADSLAPFSNAIFSSADGGKTINFLEAWGGSLAYTFQLYFDFSGYIDMATGSARILGIILPINFYAPYRSANIIEFWRRWHITLSNFLQQYLYIPLGGNRKGVPRQLANLMITMLLGGLWHGAGWTFILWGGLHGFFLTVNHLWRKTGIIIRSHSVRLLSRMLTLLSIIIAWVFFRAHSIRGALMIIRGMMGRNGILLPQQIASHIHPFIAQKLGILFTLQHSAVIPLTEWINGIGWLVIALCITFLLPTTHQLLQKYHPALHIEKFVTPSRFSLTPSMTTAFALAMIAVISIALMSLRQDIEFLYFQF